MPAQSSPESFDRAVTCEYGLPGEKLDRVIDRFVAAAKDDPFSTWLILPTRRLVFTVTGHLTVENIPFISSRICTLDGFCSILFEENRHTERYVSTSESKLLLARILAKNKKNGSLFITRDNPSSGTVNDLIEFMRVILKRKVAFPECLVELQSEKSEELDTIIRNYRNYLRDQNLVDGDTLLEWTIDQINQSDSLQFKTVFIYGFYEPLPLEQDLFESIGEHSQSTQFSIPAGKDKNIFRDQNEDGFTGAPSRELALTSLFAGSGPLDLRNFLYQATFSTRYGEVHGIAAEISRLNARGILLSDIAVVFPDLWRDLGLIDEVFSDFGIRWNEAVGSRLSQAPLVQFLSSIAYLSEDGYTREAMVRLIGSPYIRNVRGPGGHHLPDAAETDLVSRYAKIDGPHPDWNRQLGRLHEELQNPKRAKNYPGISVHSVERVQDGIHILLEDLHRLSGTKCLRDHARGFREFLDAWGIPYLNLAPDDPVRQREIQIYQTFCSHLEALETVAWLPQDEPLGPDEFARFIRAIGEERDDSGRKNSGGVTVLGLQECQHIRFPVVFIGGLLEGAVPSLTTRLPFTNSLENTRMGTRTLSEILREEQYYFIAALLSAEKTLYLSAPLADGDKILLTSAFFERVRARAGDCPWPEAGEDETPASQRMAAVRAGESIRDGTVCAATGLVPASLCIDDLVERINMERFYRHGLCDSAFDGILAGDESIGAVLAGRYGPDHVWSPTSLETYATCPFAYFLKRVIGLNPLPEVELNLSASDRGTVIHDILCSFYRQWQAGGYGKVSLSTIADATDLILRIAEEELGKYSFMSPLWDATRILMQGGRHTGPGYFERFLESEAFEADSPLVPSRFEFSFGMQSSPSDDPASSPEPVELAAPEGGEKLRIRGRIDRIDLTPAGEFLIYDYKSGSQHPKAKDIEAGTALQLPLYLLAFGQITGSHGIGGGYYTIRREIGRSIVLADPLAKDLMVSRIRPSADFAGLIRHSRECAFSYIDGIRNGRFPLPPKEKCPNEYCDFRQVCRFDPYRVLEAGEDT